MMSGCFSTNGRPLETVVNHTIGKNGTSMTFSPARFDRISAGGVTNAASASPSRTASQ